MITIATYATKRYAYALPNFGRRIAASIVHAKKKKGTFLFVTDKSETIEHLANKYVKEVLPDGWNFELIQLDIQDDDLKNYKNDAQLMIAHMQGVAMTEARRIGSKYFWSLESDVLVPYNALKVSEQVLELDDGYYDVAMCTYPSQGGGSFLGGRGSYQHPIAEDYLPEEREVPEELQVKVDEREEQLKNKEFRPDEEWWKERQEIFEAIKKCPPKQDIFKTIIIN